jgi:hypothetical protein
MNATAFGMACALIPCIVAPAYGWGDEGHEVIGLIAAYIADATMVTREQLSKAGVRLALVLNRALH